MTGELVTDGKDSPHAWLQTVHTKEMVLPLSFSGFFLDASSPGKANVMAKGGKDGMV